MYPVARVVTRCAVDRAKQGISYSRPLSTSASHLSHSHHLFRPASGGQYDPPQHLVQQVQSRVLHTTASKIYFESREVERMLKHEIEMAVRDVYARIVLEKRKAMIDMLSNVTYYGVISAGLFYLLQALL